MKHELQIIFGKEQVNKFHSNIALTKEENEINVKNYSFDSKAELLAFKKGIDECIGWQDYVII